MTARRLWLLWKMSPRAGPRHFDAVEPALVAEDIVRLGHAEGIAAVELVRLGKAGDRHPLWYDWMLVIDIDAPDAHHPVEAFFEDLRSVGARPMMLRQVR